MTDERTTTGEQTTDETEAHSARVNFDPAQPAEAEAHLGRWGNNEDVPVGEQATERGGPENDVPEAEAHAARWGG